MNLAALKDDKKKLKEKVEYLNSENEKIETRLSQTVSDLSRAKKEAKVAKETNRGGSSAGPKVQKQSVLDLLRMGPGAKKQENTGQTQLI